MKRILSFTGIIVLLGFLIVFPSEALSASQKGMSLWLNTLVPTLLPFLILTGILIHTDGIEKILSPFRLFWKKMFGLSPCGAYAFLLGMLCGYPMGAKLSADLYTSGKISRREAHYLLTFCSNPSPAFIITYLGHICLEGKIPGRYLLIIFILADFLCMLVFRFLICKNQTETDISMEKKETSIAGSPEAIADVSIMNGFETITRLGGYILLFSILGACINHFWPFPPVIKHLTLGCLEITTGLHLLAQSPISFTSQFLYSMALTSLGGFCILAQTKSVLAGKLSLLPYMLAKLMNAFFTVLLSLCFVKTF